MDRHLNGGTKPTEHLEETRGQAFMTMESAVDSQHPKHKHKGRKTDKLVSHFKILYLKGHHQENEKRANKQEKRGKICKSCL